MPPPQLFVTITSPIGGLPFVDRTFQLTGNISWLFAPSNWTLTGKNVSVQFGPGGAFVGGTFSPGSVNWQCTGTVPPTTPWGSMVQVSVRAQATFRFLLAPGEPDFATLNVSTTLMVRLLPAIPPTIGISPFTSPIVAPQMPVAFAFAGSASGPQAPVQVVQYKVEGGEFANAVNVSGNWSQFRITLPLPPTSAGNDHTLTIRAIDTFGTVGTISVPIAVQAQPPIVVPPGSKTTFSGAPTTSSITSWTRLEPQSADADMGVSSRARLFDPLWLLTRQWQMGEFQGEDAGTPIQARVRATSAMLTRRFLGEVSQPSGPGPAVIQGQPYDPSSMPLEVLVERRRMRAADADDTRMVTFAVDAGLHFLRMVEQQTPSNNYRTAFLTKFALRTFSIVDAADSRYLQSMIGRAPDGRQIAATLRTIGAAQLVTDPVLNIATGDRVKVQTAASGWLTWYDAMCSEPGGAGDDAWNAPRLEYAVSVGARLSASPQDEMTFSATEVDGPIDWSSFDVNARASLTTAADQRVTSLVEAVIPAPVNVPGVPAPRFWEMEDARIAYGLVPVGPTDLAHLMMIEYASTYGNDWFLVPLTLPVGSVTRVDSLVVTDTFGVRSLVRPMNDPALPPAFFSMWQSSSKDPIPSAALKVVPNRFFLPPTLSRTLDGAPLEDVLFMRDEMANLAWAIERTVENAIEVPAKRDEAADTAPPAAGDLRAPSLPRYLVSSPVPPNWLPLLPVQIPNPRQPANTPGQVLSRLKLGAVLQPDGRKTVHRATGEILGSDAGLLLFDEEIPREGARITRQRRLARWTDGSTWLWTGFRNEVGQGEGASALTFDQLIAPQGTPGDE